MEREIAGLFDLDGVILDTEDFYSQFWGEQGRLYCPEIPDFTAKVKGRTLSDLLTTYFPGKEQAETIIRKLGDFERQMPFRFIAGADGFIRDLKAHGVKLAIVTSSNDAKMAEVYRVLPQLKEWFDVIVTADKITRSKPAPECYLLAAEELQYTSARCIVFEDSFSGIEAGKRAGMKVIGLATTNSAEAIRNKADAVIPDFRGFSYNQLIRVYGQID